MLKSVPNYFEIDFTTRNQIYSDLAPIPLNPTTREQVPLPYTADKNRWVLAHCVCSGTSTRAWVTVNGVYIDSIHDQNDSSHGTHMDFLIYVGKGAVVDIVSEAGTISDKWALIFS